MQSIEDEIRALVMQKNYPCVAAVQSVVRGESVIKTYRRFGSGSNWSELRSDLIEFIKTQKRTESRYLSFWAVFAADASDSEQVYEKKFWNELSLLSSEELRATDWGPENSSDPNDPSFCVSLEGVKLFVVGLHPASSRLARRFSRPAMVFNVFSQFEKFEQEGTYKALVEHIRERDVKFQGSVNPMVEAHGDKWEAIQFSGQKNADNWKCPFHFIKNADKPDV